MVYQGGPLRELAAFAPRGCAAVRSNVPPSTTTPPGTARPSPPSTARSAAPSLRSVEQQSQPRHHADDGPRTYDKQFSEQLSPRTQPVASEEKRHDCEDYAVIRAGEQDATKVNEADAGAKPEKASEDFAPTPSDPMHTDAHKPSNHTVGPPSPDGPLLMYHRLLIAFGIAFPNAVMVILFSKVGFGLELFNAVAPQNMNLTGDFLIFVASLIIVTLFIFDVANWRKLAKGIVAALPLFLIAVGCVLKARKYPWAPLLMSMFWIPATLGIMRATLCKKVQRSRFYATISVCLAVCGLLVAVAWASWVFSGADRTWGEIMKANMRSDSTNIYDSVWKKQKLVYDIHCSKSKDLSMYSNQDRTKIGKACGQAMTCMFLLYFAPLVAIICNFFMALFCYLQGVLVNVQDMSRLQKSLKQFVLSLALMLGGMYASVNVSGASLQLGSTLMAFFAAALAALLAWAYLEVGPQAIVSIASASPITQMLAKVWTNDWFRAILVGGFNVLIPLFFVVNSLNMKVRRCLGKKDQTERFTPLGMRAEAYLDTWNWVSILLKVHLLGELFFVMQVGIAKLTYVFLSWLNQALSNTAFGLIIIICIVVGYTMFLLPPVPGVPVYVFVGIVLAAQGEKIDSIGFGGGIAIALVTSFFLKLLACTGQYMIGYSLGKSLKVQQLIGVDKVMTRAIEYILAQRGLSLGKVAVLVGGPDWPTSVTCGILKLNIPQMLWGTCPVIMVVGPCVCAGAFMGKVTAGEDSHWNMLASVAIGSSLLVNMVASFVAVYKIMNVVQERSEELAQPRKEHEAVAALTQAEKAYKDVYAEVTTWSALSCWKQVVLLGGVGMQLLSGFIFVMAAESCFRPFNISSKISDPYVKDGLEGNTLNIVISPYGWIALGMFVSACVLHYIFAKAVSMHAKSVYKSKS